MTTIIHTATECVYNPDLKKNIYFSIQSYATNAISNTHAFRYSTHKLTTAVSCFEQPSDKMFDDVVFASDICVMMSDAHEFTVAS